MEVGAVAIVGSNRFFNELRTAILCKSIMSCSHLVHVLIAEIIVRKYNEPWHMLTVHL
jgi:hypothetical protein